MSSSLRELARQIVELRREVRRAVTQPQLAHSSIEDGALQVYDSDGSVTMIIGTQHDGSSTAAVVNGPIPPTPFAPGVASAPGGVVVVWSGLWEDPEAVAPMDFARVEVHVSTEPAFLPGPSTLRGVFSSPLGGELFVSLPEIVEHYACLIARSESGRASLPSALVAGTPTPTRATTVEQSFTAPTDGGQTLALSIAPTGRVDLWWEGVWQPSSEWSLAGSTITVPDSPAGTLLAGQEFVVKYET